MKKRGFLLASFLLIFTVSCDLPFGLGYINLPWEKRESQTETPSESVSESTKYSDSVLDSISNIDLGSETQSIFVSGSESESNSETTNAMVQYTQSVTKKHDQPFKILNLTDIELDDGDSSDIALEVIDSLVEKEKPDMIVFLGDLMKDDRLYDCKKTTDLIINKIDSFDIPWAPIFGECDDKDSSTTAKSLNKNDLIGKYENAKNCLFMEGPSDVKGISNYVVNVIDETTKEISETLIFLDTESDGFDNTHTKFYEAALDYAKELNNNVMPSSTLYSHMPLDVYAKAYENAKLNEYHGVVGSIYNASKVSSVSNDLFESIKSLGSTHLTVCGHEHDNAYYTAFEGIKLAYSMKSSQFGASDNNYPLIGGSITQIGGKDDFYYVPAGLSFNIDGSLTIRLGSLSYWRYSGCSLEFDLEIPSSGDITFNLEGTNMNRYSKSYEDRLGSWNRLTQNEVIHSNKTCNFGTLTKIDGNKYHYSIDLAKFPLNNSSGEVSCGDETLMLLYFYNCSKDYKFSNMQFVHQEITETNQIDLSLCTIDSIEDQIYKEGQQSKPTPIVKYQSTTLTAVDDIIYTYENNYEIGTATLKVIPSGKGMHKYKGELVTTFNIVEDQNRGVFRDSATSIDILPCSVTAGGTITIDYKFVDVTKDADSSVSLYLGTNLENCYGDYTIYKDRLEESYDGIGFEQIGGGYNRIKIDVSELTKVNGKAPTLINKVLFQSFEASSGVLFDIKVDANEATYRGTLTMNASATFDCGPYTINNGGTLIIDYMYADPVADAENGVSMFFGTSLSNCLGNYKIFNNKMEKSYDGVSFKALDDGYYRVTIDVSQLNKTYAGNPTTIDKILFKWFEPSKGVYFDINPASAMPKYRGINRSSTNTNPIEFNSYTVSDGGTLIIDYKYVDAEKDASNGISMCLGSDLNNSYGNYKIYSDHLDEKYDGITLTTLEDGYNRMTIDVSLLTKVNKTAPEAINKIMFDSFDVTGGVYFDVNTSGRAKSFVVTMSSDTLKIVNFTDVHIQNVDSLKSDTYVVETINYGMSTAKPDMVIFSGDFVHYATDERVNAFLAYMDTFKVPYFFLFGNHDRENGMSASAIADCINKSKYGHIELGPEDLESTGNYVIKINNQKGELVHALIMMDTRNKKSSVDASLVEYVTDPVSGVKYGTYSGRKTYCDPGWDGIRGPQIEWYEETVKSLGCETSLFCHAPLLEFCKAYEVYKKAVNNKDAAAIAACDPIGNCIMGEPSCGAMENFGMFALIKELGSTKNVICGHDHLNDFSLMYEGVRLTYSVKTANLAYWNNNGSQCGYTELIIDNSGKTTLNQVYYNPITN